MSFLPLLAPNPGDATEQTRGTKRHPSCCSVDVDRRCSERCCAVLSTQYSVPDRTGTRRYLHALHRNANRPLPRRHVADRACPVALLCSIVVASASGELSTY